MGSLLDKAKEIKRNKALSSGNSVNSGLREKAMEIKRAKVLGERLNHLNNEYNRTQSNLVGADATKYSNQKGYMDRVNQANNVAAYADSIRQYASTIGGINHDEVNNYLDSIQSNVKYQNDYRKSLGDYMSQFKDEDDFNNYQKYSGSSQAEIEARIERLNNNIKDMNNLNRDTDIKERDWLNNYFNTQSEFVKNTDVDSLKDQLEELEEEIDIAYSDRMMANNPEDGRKADERIAELEAVKKSLQQRYDMASAYSALAEIEDLKSKGYTPASNYGGALLNSAGQGAYDTMINNVVAFADATLGKPLRYLEDNTTGNGLGHLIGKGYDWTDNISEIYKNQSLIDSTEYNSGIEKFGMGSANVIASALPTVAIAVATGGVGAATGAKSIGTYLKSLAKNPQYWASFVNMGGATYDSAIEEGATYEEALASALLNGAIGAATEVGTGFEKKLTNSNTFKNWLTSALEEGGEEVIQGVLENGIKKGVYDHDREWISGTDENAVINPIRMAQEFGYGALAGGLLSGGNIVASGAANAGVNAYQQNKAYKEIGQDIKGSESLDAYTQYAVDNKLIKGAANVSDIKMGKIAEKVETNIKQSIMNASSLKELTDAYDEVSKYNSSELTAIATHHYIQKVREMQNGMTNENPAHTDGFDTNTTISSQNNENVREMTNNHTDEVANSSAQTASVVTSSGNKAFITGIVEVNEEDATVSLSDGTIAKVSELEIPNKEFAKVWGYALSHNNTNLAKNITSNFVMQTYADDYIHNYGNMLSVGRMGMDYKAYEAITENAENRIGVGVAYSAYSFGNGKFGTEEKTVNAKKPSKKSKAQYTKEEGVKDSPMDVLYEGVSKKLGIEIKKVKRLFAGEDAEANAQLVVTAASIMVSENADNEYANFIHELGEGVLAYNPKAYADLRKAILEYAVVSEGVGSLDQLIKKKQKMYAEVEGSETYTEAMNEVVNDILGGMFANDEGVKQFTDWLQDKSGYSVKEQKTFLQKLCDLLKSIADAIKNFIKSGKVNEANIIGLKMQGKRAMEIRSQFLKALEGMKENIEQGNVVEVSDSVKYSVKDYNTSIDEIWNGTKDFEASHIYVCDTPQFLVDIGFRKLPMLMTKKHVITDMFTEEEAKNKGYKVKKDAHFHGMGEELMKKIPEMLNEPVMIIKHTDSPFDTEIGILTNQTDKNGNLIIIGITPNADGYISVQVGGDLFKTAYKETNRINTAYGNDKIKMFLKSAKQEGRILFYDKTKSQVINSILRVLFPNNLDKLDFSKNLAQYSSIVKGVNAGYAKNSLKDSEGRNLTDAQIDYFKDSQIKDSNGNLKVMYHGSPESFTVFDKKKAKSSGYYGSGFYFTESASHAKQYGSNYKVYLNITNPMQAGPKNITKAQLKKFVKAVADNEDYGIENYGYDATVDSVVNDVYGKDDFAMITDINASCIGDMVAAVQLFNEVNGTAYDGIVVPTETVAFYPNQIKNTDNLNPTENEDIRYSLKDLTEEDYSTIKEFFGTTNNYKVAGYLLKDGSMLDFSGKHWGNPNPYMRTVDHRDIWDVWENPDTDGYDEMVNMIGNGNIRLMAEVGGINLAALPTNEQMNTLKGYIKNFGGKVVVDIDEIGGDTIESFGYDKGTSADSILGNIEDYFKKGNHQSDLMAFHTKFSLKEDAEPENSNNLDQSEMYKAQVEALSGIFEVTKGKKVKTSSLRSVASMIRKRYNSTYDYNHLVNDLRIIYDYASSGKVAVNDLMGMTQMLSKLVLQESANNREISAEAKALLNNIKVTRIMLSDAQKEEIAYYYDSFNEYRKKNFGKLTIANNGTSLDTVWKQFSETHPEWFDADVSELDQPMRLAEIVQALSEDYRSEEGFDIEDASTYMALELFNSYFIALDSQISEQHKTEINRLKSKYSTRMDKIKKQAKEKYESKLQEVKQADRERLAKLRTTKNAKLEEQRAKFAMKKREAVSKVRENAAKTKVKKRIIKTAKDIISWLNAPTDKKHVPEPFRKVSLDFLTSIDFVSVNAKPDSQNTLRWKDKMEKLKTQLLEVASGLNDKSDENCNAFINAIDPDLVPMINAFISANEGKANISEMDVAQLEELNKIMKSLKSAIVNANKMFANKRAETVGEISEASISEIDKFKRKKYHNKLTKGLTKLFNIDMLDAFSYFDMLGESAKSICEEIREGFNVRTFDIYDAQKFIEDTKHNMDIKDKDVKKWTSTVHEFADKQGKTFKMTTTQLMSLYSLSKREQARKHIFGEGIKVAEIKAIKERQVEEHQVNEEILAKMFEPLTEKQKNFADALQNYMSSVSAEWGNEVSMQMYGYKKFTEKFYFPISSSENSLDENGRKEQKDASCYTIRSLGMTKPLDPKATNAINTIDIFDVFANHIVDMSNYHAFALPLSDAMRWYNYKADGNNLKESIDGAFGKEGQAFFVNLIRDINGEVKTGTSVGLDWFTGNYKAASVGLNLRVMAQQPTAYFRAGMVINPKYLIAGRVRYDLIKDSFAECKKYSAIAIWKSWGYNETMMGQSMKGTITGQQSVRDKMNEFSGFLNQKADEWTWGWLWNVVKVEQMDAHKDMDIHSEEFLKLVAKRFDEVIDETQVVDTVLHKSQLMRDKSKNMLTAFMSEPTKTYNMIHNQVMKIYQNPHDTEAWKGLARAVATFVFTTAVTAAVKSFIDSFRHRDKEEYEEWGEQFLNEMKRNAWDDFNPFTLIPVFKEILPIFDAITGKEYFESTRFDTASFTQLALFITQVKKYISGESNYTPYYLIKSGSQALSSLTGVPAYNIYRTLTTLHNTIAENPLPMKVSEEEAQEFDERIEQLEKGTANFDDMIEAEQEEYLKDYPTATDEKAKEHGVSAVRSKVTAEYKEEYVNAFKMGYSSKMKDIKKHLETSGLYEDVDETLMDWLVSNLRTEYLKAKTDAERTTIRQQLWKTGKWKTVRALDKQIEEWRK